MKDSRGRGPLISVILPVYNNAAHVGAALESVLRQIYRPLECLVVDDGSSDESLAIAERIAAETNVIQVLRHSDHGNHGVAASRNLGIQHSQGDYLAFLDADDLWHPQKLDKQVAFMEANPDVGLSFTRARIQRQNEDIPFIPDADELGSPPYASRPENLQAILDFTLNYVFSTVMVRRSIQKIAGLFDEDLQFQCEDRIWVAKCSAIAQMGFIDGIYCDYQVHEHSYTAEVLRTGIMPAVAFEMRTRVFLWLKKAHPEARRLMALIQDLLFRSFISAWACSASKIIRRVIMHYFFSVLAAAPASIPRALGLALRHSRINVFHRRS